jgi:hypothetical protein
MAMTSQASHHGGCHGGGGWMGCDWVGWVGRASWSCLSAGSVQRCRSAVQGSAETPRVMGVEQLPGPGHAPLQVGPYRIGWVATGRSPLLGVGGLPQGQVGLWRAVASRAGRPDSVGFRGAAVGVQRGPAHSAAGQDRVGSAGESRGSCDDRPSGPA